MAQLAFSLLTVVCLAACASRNPVGPGEPEAPPAEVPLVEPAPATSTGDEAAESGQTQEAEPESDHEAIELVRAGDYRSAREVLGLLLVQQDKDLALSLLKTGLPEDALVAVDRALKVNPRDPETVFLKARSSFALGLKAIDNGGPGTLVNGAFLDALRFYERGGEEIRPLLGAARAAVRLQRYEQGMDFARRAVVQLDELGIEPEVALDPNTIEYHRASDAPLVLEATPERVLAEATYRAYVAAKQADPEGARAQELFVQAEDALDRLLGRSRESWTWTTLVDLYLWKGDLVSARGQAENGLAHNPLDADLADRLANIAHQSGGPTEVAASFASFNRRHPDNARGLWYEAQGAFDRATDAVMPLVTAALTGEVIEEPKDSDQVRALFKEAEEIFGRCRILDPEYESACLGYEALTRNGLGWYLFTQGSLEASTEAFLSTEDVYTGGLFAELQGRLLSGVQGIAQVGGAQNERGDWRAAGEAFALIAAVDRSRSTWANNQGFFYRDAAVELELLGHALCAAAELGVRDQELLTALAQRTGIDLRQKEMQDDAALMKKASGVAMKEARRQMQLSWEGYQLAAELAPDDVRIVNDAGLVLVYYLHDNLDLAEELLRRAMQMGQEQMSLAADMDEMQRFEIANAWGDSYQNMGVLYANERDDPEQAIAFFERAIEIGPDPRPLLTNTWIPFLRGELGTEGALPAELRFKTWADPCEH